MLALLYLFNRFFYRLFVWLRLHSPYGENFSQWRLIMGVGERFCVRLVAYVAYGLLVVTAVVWLFSEILWMKVIAIVLAVFLLDRLWWLKKESASAWLIVEYALDRSALFGGPLYLWVAERLVTNNQVEKFLKNKNINPDNLETKIKGKLKSMYKIVTSKKDLVALAGDLMGNGIALTPVALFLRLVEKSEDVRILVGDGIL